MNRSRRAVDLAASAPGLIIGALGAGLSATATRKHRRQAERAAEAEFPGQLRVLGSRTLFPQNTGSEITFALAGDPEAVVRLRVGTRDGAGLAEAVAAARARADDLRRLLAVFTGHGCPVVAYQSAHRRPWVATGLANENSAERLREIGECVRAWTAGAPTTTQVAIVRPELARRVPDEADLPVPLRLDSRRRWAVLLAEPAHVASYPPGVAEPSVVYLTRSFQQRHAFEARVSEQAARWLRRRYPEAVVLHSHGLWSLVPGRVDRSAGHLLFAERQAPRGTVTRPEHALTVTVDNNGTFTGTPVVHRDVRDERGSITLPTDPQGRSPK
ncbi:hypothetical protein [Amycolatopsis magusensis]|uniref:hypothetical protein n=1 Tax=Amycolatopsis magusensis TaxID=882444 RepID=UPI0024A9AE0B|nr:hypothetical protein [Amycolatopsis magusensis]MDI5976169.1 hypothetical protein [Amycolatopsis magusensis]